MNFNPIILNDAWVINISKNKGIVMKVDFEKNEVEFMKKQIEKDLKYVEKMIEHTSETLAHLGVDLEENIQKRRNYKKLLDSLNQSNCCEKPSTFF